MNTNRLLSRREMLNKLAWPIFIILVGAYLLMLGLIMGKNVGFIVLGLMIIVVSIWVGWKKYSIKSDEVKPQTELGKIISKIDETMASIFAVIFPVFIVLAVVVSIIGAIFSADKEQEKYLKESKMDATVFFKFACQSKSICKNYADVRLSCAEAGSIQKCIEIKMKGDDYSVCTDDGKIYGLDEKLVPNFAQCMGNKVSSFVSSK